MLYKEIAMSSAILTTEFVLYEAYLDIVTRVRAERSRDRERAESLWFVWSSYGAHGVRGGSQASVSRTGGSILLVDFLAVAVEEVKERLL